MGACHISYFAACMFGEFGKVYYRGSESVNIQMHHTFCVIFW